MSLKDNIEKVNRKFGKKVAHYLMANLEIALKKGGSKNVQDPALSFNEVITTTNNGVIIQIVASGEYWYYLDKGRKRGKMPPPNVLGKEWQVSQKIDPRKVLAEIEVKANKKNGLTSEPKNMTKPKKKLSFDMAAKELSFVLARSIGRKGYKPRPFVQKTIDEIDIDGYAADIINILGDQIKIELNIK